MLDDVKQDLAALIKDNNATIITHFEVEKLHYARKNLRSIIHNLLSNALKYCSAERPPEVLIETRHTQHFTILHIQDNGEGIHERNKNKIFALFKRLHTHVEGSGMGLYIVKRIMENSGGSIEVTSELGKGTTFILNFRNDISL